MTKTLKECYDESYEKAVQDNNLIHHSDKGTNHSYINIYENILSPYKEKKINFLEIGVNKGYSMFTWQKYFTNATFYGIDIQDIAFYREGYNFILGDINNTTHILNSLGDVEFDIIIDDGSHIINDQIHALNILYSKLKEGGLYVVEDINDIDNTKHMFNNYKYDIYDNRVNQNRWDDALIIIKK